MATGPVVPVTVQPLGLVLHDVGEPGRAEAGDEAVDADLDSVCVARRRSEHDEDAAVTYLRAALGVHEDLGAVGDELYGPHIPQPGDDPLLVVGGDVVPRR